MLKSQNVIDFYAKIWMCGVIQKNKSRTERENVMKKRYVVLVMMLVMAMFVLGGCGKKKDEVAGAYKFYAMEEEGGYVSIDLFKESGGEEMADFFEGFVLVLKEDGTGTLTMDEELPMTWKRDGDHLTLTNDGVDGNATYKSGVIELDAEGIKMLFVREGGDVSGYKFMTLDEWNAMN